MPHAVSNGEDYGDAPGLKAVEGHRNDLGDLRREVLRLHTAAVKDELAEAQLAAQRPRLERLLQGGRYFSIPVAEFREEVAALHALLSESDPNGRTAEVRLWKSSIDEMVRERQQRDKNDMVQRNATAQTASKATQEEQYAAWKALRSCQGEMRTPEQSHFEAVERKVQLLEALAGVKMCFIPAGVYTVGYPSPGEDDTANERKDAREAVTSSRPVPDEKPRHCCGFSEAVEAQTRADSAMPNLSVIQPPPGYRLPTTPQQDSNGGWFFISETPLTSSQIRKLANAVLHFPALAELLKNQRQFAVGGRNEHYVPVHAAYNVDVTAPLTAPGLRTSVPTPLRYEAVSVAEDDGDEPPAEVTYFLAQSIASSLGCQLPSWKQWETACRGKEGYLYPWGDVFEPLEAYLEDGYLSSFGRYKSARSPFGLCNLCRAGREWNSVSGNELQGTFNKVFASRANGDAPPTHVLRSLSDHLGPGPEMADSVPAAQFHKTFLGPALCTYGAPHGNYRAAAFRLVLSLHVPPISPPRLLSIESVLSLLGRPEWSVLNVLGRVEDRLELQHSRSSLNYFSKGVSAMAAGGVITSVVLYSGPTENYDWAPCSFSLSKAGPPVMLHPKLSAADVPVWLQEEYNVGIQRTAGGATIE
eukprot:gene17522-26955_t